jgi:pyruvate dehydrogenase E2 component (dihydrolipoamide acetyltransferase)
MLEVTVHRAPARRALASPKARRLAAAQGLDLESIAGSGPGGSIVAADVETRVPEPTPTGAVWRVMAERTTASWQTVPHFYLRRTVDVSALQRRREEAGSGVTHTDLLVQSSAEALRRHGGVNVTWHDGRVVPHADVHVAIAIATDGGLVAPVIHHADRLDLSAIASRRQELVAAARAGRLRPDDVSGGTFTVSNLGMYGVDSFDAIVNAPQAAILAVGRIAERIVAVAGQPAVRPMLDLTISFDHRAVDGANGAQFLDTLARILESETS